MKYVTMTSNLADGEREPRPGKKALRLVELEPQRHGERDRGLLGRPVAVVAADLGEELSRDVRALVHLGVGEPARVDEGKKSLREGRVDATE